MTRVATWTYRAALLACPPGFRREFGARMLEDFRSLLAECGGAPARLGLALRESTDVVRAAWRDSRAPGHLSPLGPGKPPARDRVRLLWDDVVFAARSLRSRPGYALVSVATLALGIGASTMVFSVVDKVVIQPLPYPDDDRFVFVFAHDRNREAPSNFPTTPADYHDWKNASSSFAAMSAVRERAAVMTGGNHPERIRLGEVTDETFVMLGARPHLGTVLNTASDPHDVVLTHGTWLQVFGADPGVIGREVSLDGEVHTVVGVAEPGFRHPWGRTAMWRPLRFGAERTTDRSTRDLIVLAKLRDGISYEQAQQEMVSITDALSREYPETNELWGVFMPTLKDRLLRDNATMYAVLSVAVGLVLLITCVNLASLVLARGTSRQAEVAIRMALGAGRLRVARLLLAEGVLIAAGGAAIGLLVAHLGLNTILPLAPRWPLVVHESEVSARSFAFAFGVTLFALQLFSVLPTVRLTRPGPGDSLRGTRTASAGRSDLRFRRLLIVGQMTLALVLLVGASLLVRSTYNIVSSDTGFNYEGIVSTRITMNVDDQDADAFFDQLLGGAQAIPGVDSAALVDAAPMDGTGDWVRIFIDGDRKQAERALGADIRRVTPAYFEMLGIDRLTGRSLTSTDAGAPVALINQEFIRRFLGGHSPVGMTIETAPPMGGGTNDRTQWTIVGVVETVEEWGPASFEIPMIYVPHSSAPATTMSLLMRTDLAPDSLVEPVRQIVREVGDSPIGPVVPIAAYFEDSYRTQRFMLALIGSFAVLAGILSAVGLYGVMAYHVIQRRREIGVRIALGAVGGDVAGLVLRQGAGMALIAAVLGVGAAVPLARAMSTMNFGRLLVDMHWFDPVVFAAVPLLVLLTAILASWLPARRAARVDPVEALRADA